MAVLIFLFYNLFFVYVRPDEYGIKVERIGLNRGVQKEIYDAGLTFLLSFGLQQMPVLPKGIQVLELTNSPQTAAKEARKDRAAHIQASEADLLEKPAEAEKVHLKNDALKGSGSERMVGPKMADVYKGLDVTILPSDGPDGVNPLNLNRAMQLFDVRKGGGQ